MTNKDKQNATYKRYHDRAYKRYAVTLHKEQHSKIIEHIEENKKNGKSPTQTLIELFKEK